MFLEAARRDGRLHAFPQTLATVTGRMMLPGVPLQTAPKGELALASANGTLTAAIRAALVTGEHEVTGSVDFTTMELRIAAGLSEDARLTAVVEAGDAHLAVARRLFETRSRPRNNGPSRRPSTSGSSTGWAAKGSPAGSGSRRRRPGVRRPLVEAFPAVRKLRERLADEERTSLWGRRLPGRTCPNTSP